ncbi:MAG TPA: hydrogen gas-evolving membrane-bound hydrogenase subunit E, partial [Devosia sp.]|nr:hydrogen gas-evolving membrane-bound hydrogenase subunit E [Devosia sp.]
AGIIDHGTGTRDIRVLGGLRDTLTISFIAAALAGLSMFGVPPLLGYLAKEEMYAALGTGDLASIAIIVALVAGNALIGAVALALVIRPFMGELKPTPEPPHEAGLPMWIGPALFGLASLAVMFGVGSLGEFILAPMASSIVGHAVESHLSYAVHFDELPIWLSVATWMLGIVLYLGLDRIRDTMEGAARRFAWTFDRGFDQAMFALIRLAGMWVRAFHHGRLEFYTLMAFGALILCLIVPLATLGGWPHLPEVGHLTIYEWGAIAMAAGGVATVVAARTRLGAIVALGIQGSAVGLIFLFFGAPDLAFTQFMIEILSVVIFTLVMTRLNLSTHDRRVFEDWSRDGTIAVLAGAAVTLVLLRILEGAFDGRLSEFFLASSYAVAHGRNVVNVIIVDFRGLDTLGEISVVMGAAIAILAMLRRQHHRERDRMGPPAPVAKEEAA